MKLFKTIIISSVACLLFMFGTIACGTTEDPNASCTGCTVSSPWSKAGTGNCYATQADCELSEGTGCVLCN
ncbi:MAG: hypothetical protein OEW75_18345 [Cyclobacteriaceae bacterium]|nr:hypothetical protein [Cyclobacteriaceae bacterium]